MSVSIESQGRGGKKDLNASLNLVPYIDLLTCMVAFLLITAVWTQLAQLKTSQVGPAKDNDGVEPPMTKISLVVGQDEINVLVNQDREVLPNKDGEADLNALSALLKRAKSLHPDKDDVQIASADTVRFDRLANVMDVTIAAGFPGVALLPSGEAGL
jgi:biopolymer transport protein TolR